MDKGTIKKPGQLHRDLGVPAAKKIGAKRIAAAAKRGGKVGKRALLARTLAKMRRERKAPPRRRRK